MNLHQLKQWLFNNLWHGENSRERNSREHPGVLGIVPSLLAEPDYNSLWGIDISHWDGNVDLSVTKSLGAKFVFIKAVDGTITTPNWRTNRQRAIDAKLPQSTYGWLYPNSKLSCKLQAQAYAGLLKLFPPDLPPALDFEWTYWAGASANPNYSDLEIWADEFNLRYSRKAILYSAAGYMNMFGAIPPRIKAKFDSLWVANYGVVNPTMPFGYVSGEWSVHQNYSTGNALKLAPNDVNKKELDLNKIKDNATYERLAGVVIPPPVEEPMGNIIITKAVGQYGVNARSAPNSTGEANIIYDTAGTPLFQKGDILICDEIRAGVGVGGALNFSKVRAAIRAGAVLVLPTSPTGELWGAASSPYQQVVTSFSVAGGINISDLSIFATLPVEFTLTDGTASTTYKPGVAISNVELIKQP